MSKTPEGIVEDLKDQLTILEQQLNDLKKGNVLAAQVIAPVLRNLVYKYPSNPHPLLFNVAQVLSQDLTVSLDLPPTMRSHMPLDTYLNQVAFASGTEQVTLTNYDIIKFIANQQSVAHSDPAVDADMYAAMGWPQARATVNSPHIWLLGEIAEAVLNSAKQLALK